MTPFTAKTNAIPLLPRKVSPWDSVKRDFSLAHLKPAPLRLSNKSGVTSDGQTNGSFLDVFGSNEAQTAASQLLVPPSEMESSKRQTKARPLLVSHKTGGPLGLPVRPGLAALITKFEALDAISNPNAESHLVPPSEKSRRSSSVSRIETQHRAFLVKSPTARQLLDTQKLTTGHQEQVNSARSPAALAVSRMIRSEDCLPQGIVLSTKVANGVKAPAGQTIAAVIPLIAKNKDDNSNGQPSIHKSKQKINQETLTKFSSSDILKSCRPITPPEQTARTSHSPPSSKQIAPSSVAQRRQLFEPAQHKKQPLENTMPTWPPETRLTLSGSKREGCDEQPPQSSRAPDEKAWKSPAHSRSQQYTTQRESGSRNKRLAQRKSVADLRKSFEQTPPLQQESTRAATARKLRELRSWSPCRQSDLSQKPPREHKSKPKLLDPKKGYSPKLVQPSVNMDPSPGGRNEPHVQSQLARKICTCARIPVASKAQNHQWHDLDPVVNADFGSRDDVDSIELHSLELPLLKRQTGRELPVPEVSDDRSWMQLQTSSSETIPIEAKQSKESPKPRSRVLNLKKRFDTSEAPEEASSSFVSQRRRRQTMPSRTRDKFSSLDFSGGSQSLQSLELPSLAIVDSSNSDGHLQRALRRKNNIAESRRVEKTTSKGTSTLRSRLGMFEALSRSGDSEGSLVMAPSRWHGANEDGSLDSESNYLSVARREPRRTYLQRGTEVLRKISAPWDKTRAERRSSWELSDEDLPDDAKDAHCPQILKSEGIGRRAASWLRVKNKEERRKRMTGQSIQQSGAAGTDEHEDRLEELIPPPLRSRPGGHFFADPSTGNKRIQKSRTTADVRRNTTETNGTGLALYNTSAASLKSTTSSTVTPTATVALRNQHIGRLRKASWPKKAWRITGGGAPLVAASAECSLHHPVPCKPVRLNELRRLVSLGRGKVDKDQGSLL